MKRILLAMVAITLIAFGSSSCTRDVYGCTDPYALNYNRQANVSNGTCYYAQYGDVMFWTDRNEGQVQVTINGQTATVTGFVTGGVPSCGNAVSANFSLEEGSYTYSVVAPPSPAYPNGFTASGTAVAQHGICNAYQL